MERRARSCLHEMECGCDSVFRGDVAAVTAISSRGANRPWEEGEICVPSRRPMPREANNPSLMHAQTAKLLP